MKHILRQWPTPNGVNGHRYWQCENCGQGVYSNDDMLGDKFYVDNGKGEGCVTKWFPSPTTAINSVICN